MFLIVELCCGTPPSCLKVMGWVVVVVVVGGLEQFSVSPRPLGLGFGTKGLGLRVWGQGLTIRSFRFDVDYFNFCLGFVSGGWRCFGSKAVHQPEAKSELKRINFCLCWKLANLSPSQNNQNLSGIDFSCEENNPYPSILFHRSFSLLSPLRALSTESCLL